MLEARGWSAYRLGKEVKLSRLTTYQIRRVGAGSLRASAARNAAPRTRLGAFLSFDLPSQGSYHVGRLYGVYDSTLGEASEKSVWPPST